MKISQKGKRAFSSYARLAAAAFVAAFCLCVLAVSAAMADDSSPATTPDSSSLSGPGASASAAQPESSSEIADRIDREQAGLQAAKSEMADVSSQLATGDVDLNKKRLDLAAATAMLDEAQNRYDTRLKLYESRIAAIYKLGGPELELVLLTSDDTSDALTRLSYLGEITENDRKMVDEVKAEEEQIAQLRQQVDELKQDTANGLQGLRQRQGELEAQVQQGQAQLDRDMVALATAEARERDEEARQIAELAGDGSVARGDNGSDASAAGDLDAVRPSTVVSPQPPAGLQPTGIILRGAASWYGPGFQGQRTANGEIYNMYAFTAAHKSLPFNTWLRVTYNGRSVFVRINDRGPYVGSRILDLSKASAQALGFSGVAFVTAEVYR